MELSGKRVIITGASRGIGQALARQLARFGCGLLLTAHKEDELTALSDELRAQSVNVAAMPADLSDPESREHFIRWIFRREEYPDILVNNAGIGGDFGRFENVNVSAIEKIIALNVSALIHLTHELIPVLKNRPRAKIVNISSGIARLPYPGLAVYGATKAFISSFSESLACELAKTSVDVLCFHPGFTRTSFMRTSKMDMRRIPRIFIRTPDDIASRIVRAIKADKQWAYSDFLTGFGAWFAALLPARLKTSIFSNLFWKLPDA